MEWNCWQKEVIYQIYPKCFYDSNQDGIGDLKGITVKLDYLKNLGVTMLWLYPVYESPMINNGYDVPAYQNLDPDIGTGADLEELIEEAKSRGIRILLDLVNKQCPGEAFKSECFSQMPWMVKDLHNQLRESADNTDAVKMLGAMYFFLRGIPLIYQGQELGITNCTRTPFPWDGSPCAGFSSEKPWLAMAENYRKINAERQVGRKESVFEFYKEMIGFRQNSEFSDCLIYGDITPLESNDQVLAYERRLDGRRIVCYFNFSNHVILERGGWNEARAIFGNLMDDGRSVHGERLLLKPYQAVIAQVE